MAALEFASLSPPTLNRICHAVDVYSTDLCLRPLFARWSVDRRGLAAAAGHRPATKQKELND